MTKHDVKLAWGRVGDELSSLGLKLKLHMEQEREEHEAGDDSAMREALDRLTQAIDDAADAVGNAAKDDAVRDNARNAGTRLIDAVTTTVNEAVTEVRRLS